MSNFSEKNIVTQEEIFSIQKKNTERLVNEYIDDCRARLSPLTVSSYKSTLLSFGEFLGEVQLTDAALLDVRKYLNRMKERSLCRSTISNRVAALRSFYKYAETYHKITLPFLSEIDLLDYPESAWEGKGQEPISRQEIRALLEAPENLRDTLIIAVLYYTGLRANEVATLRLDAVDTANRTMTVIGKGNKARVVPYSAQLDRIMSLWMNGERGGYVSSSGPYFFASMHGERLCANAIDRIVHRAAVKAGVQKAIGLRGDGRRIFKVHTHILRHSFAAHALEDEVPLNHIQLMMGHARITTTLKYAGETGVHQSYHRRFKGVGL